MDAIPLPAGNRDTTAERHRTHADARIRSRRSRSRHCRISIPPEGDAGPRPLSGSLAPPVGHTKPAPRPSPQPQVQPVRQAEAGPRDLEPWIGEIKGQNAGWRGIKGGLQAPGGWVGGLEPGRFGKDLSVSTRISPFRAGSSSPGAWRGPPSGIGGGREPWDRPRGEIPS
jgi:hypothetical protein